MDASYVMGLDLGQSGEPTGFAILEWPANDDPTPDSPYHLRHLERFPPGTAYPAILEAVGQKTAEPPLSKSPLVADITAVGRQVVDGLYQLKPTVVRVVIGGGHAARWVDSVGQSVPKKDLVTALQMALQKRRLKVAPGLRDVELLTAELTAFRLHKVPGNEADAPEWRVGRYDDLVFAVALACWYADQRPPQKPSPPLPPPEPRDPIARLFGREPRRYDRLFPNGPYRSP